MGGASWENVTRILRGGSLSPDIFAVGDLPRLWWLSRSHWDTDSAETGGCTRIVSVEDEIPLASSLWWFGSV
jgi:hypothetical protein